MLRRKLVVLGSNQKAVTNMLHRENICHDRDDGVVVRSCIQTFVVSHTTNWRPLKNTRLRTQRPESHQHPASFSQQMRLFFTGQGDTLQSFVDLRPVRKKTQPRGAYNRRTREKYIERQINVFDHSDASSRVTSTLSRPESVRHGSKSTLQHAENNVGRDAPRELS